MATNGRNGKNGNGASATRRRGRKNVRSRARRGLPRWLSALLVLGAIGFVGMLVLFVAAFAYYQKYADELVAPDELAINQPSFGAKIYDRNGQLLYEYVDDRSGLRRPVELANVSDAFLAATIATEDDNFFTNPGINIQGLARAAWENLPFSGTVFEGSGGSSITQQLVKNVYIPEEQRQERWSQEGIERKVKEIVYAMEMTNRYSKEQILEWYVNQISYGGVYNGIEAASQGYFGKPARDLTLAEAALLAGIPQSPAAYDPVNNPEAATERRNEILALMHRQGRIQIGEETYFELSEEQLVAAQAEPIQIAEKRFPIEAPHFVLQYIEPQLKVIAGCDPSPDIKCDAIYRDGLVVTTTLDLDLQHRANEILESWILEFEAQSGTHNGASMVLDPKTGEILAMIGSRDYFREDIEGKNNNATACNSPGSSFKPFAYLTTFLELGWGPGTYILDTPVTFLEPGGQPFTPTNPAKNFQGLITIRNALGNSLNIPANKAAAAVGADKIVTQARKMGFVKSFSLKSEERRDILSGSGGCSGGGYGPAIATGGVDITLEEMVYGYSVFANGGVMRGMTPLAQHRTGERTLDAISILKIEDAQHRVRFDVNERRGQERVVAEEYTYLVSNILSDGSAQCITFGCGGITVPGRQVAVKTGTSEPFDPQGPSAGKIGETWTFGYTPDLVVGIWAGNSDNAPIQPNIYSTSIAFRAVRDTLVSWYDGRAGTPFTRPANVVEGSVCVPSGMKPTPLCGRTTNDLFAKDSLPKDDDTWWQRVRIDGRTGLLAGPATPAPFVQEQVMLVLPKELMETEDDKKRAEEWASALNIPLAPTETSPDGGNSGPTSDLPAVIFSPSAGQTVSGQVQIIGRASSSGFQSYRLEFGQGNAPRDWTTISQANSEVASGPLGFWDTRNLDPGTYTLRLVVQDRQRNQIVAAVTVTVSAATPTSASPTPAARP